MLHDLLTAARSEANCRRALRIGLLCLLAATAALTLHAFEGDLVEYHRYGVALLHGSHRGHLPIEYPALSALAFVFPRLLPLPYDAGFVLLMCAALIALLVVAHRLGTDGAWLDRTVLYLGLGTFTILFARYDLLPATAVIVAVLEARRERWGPAWLAAAVGGALKLFPFLLLPGFIVVEWRQRGRLPWKRTLVTLAALAALALAQEALAPGSVLSPILYEWHRGFEYSSVGATLTTLIDPFHLRWLDAFHTHEVAGAGFAAIRTLLGLGAIAAILATLALAWRRRLDVATVSLAILSVAILSDRAFAPQYLVWLAPLWALWPLRRAWVVAAIFTTLTYPIGIELVVIDGHSYLPATLIAMARNIVLLVGTCAWFAQQLKSSPRMTVGEGVISDLDLVVALDHAATAIAHPSGARRLPAVVAGVAKGGAPSPSDGG